MIGDVRPKKILICMIYYPDTNANAEVWAGKMLKLLTYDKNPLFLQSIIKRLYELAICEIEIDGTEIVPVPLFSALDGKTQRIM